MDFGHPDFSRFASGLFHLRPPTAPVVPQWNLSAVIRFYERVDSDACSFRLLLLKTLCLTALASLNRCSELAHISRRAIVDQGASITFPSSPAFCIKTKPLLGVPLLFPSLLFLTLLSALSRPSAFFFVVPPHGTTGTSCSLIRCPMPL